MFGARSSPKWQKLTSKVNYCTFWGKKTQRAKDIAWIDPSEPKIAKIRFRVEKMRLGLQKLKKIDLGVNFCISGPDKKQQIYGFELLGLQKIDLQKSGFAELDFGSQLQYFLIFRVFGSFLLLPFKKQPENATTAVGNP